MSSANKEPISFRHAYRPIGVIVGALVVAALVRAMLTPATFGQYGQYRGAAVEKARAPTPRHRGEAACKKCHPKK